MELRTANATGIQGIGVDVDVHEIPVPGGSRPGRSAEPGFRDAKQGVRPALYGEIASGTWRYRGNVPVHTVLVSAGIGRYRGNVVWELLPFPMRIGLGLEILVAAVRCEFLRFIHRGLQRF